MLVNLKRAWCCRSPTYFFLGDMFKHTTSVALRWVFMHPGHLMVDVVVVVVVVIVMSLR